MLLLPLLLVLLAGAVVVGYRFWYEGAFYVTTDNAQVTGDLVQFGSLNAGRVVAIKAEVGARVQRDQEVAVVAMPQPVGGSPIGGAQRLDETGGNDTLVSVRAPVGGIIAARSASVGSMVAAGQAMYSIVDPNRIWVNANVEETKVARVRPGQPVEVHADAVGRAFPGRVVAVTPASAATFSLLPQQNASGNFTKVTQLVPVRIAVDTGGAVLPLGTSVTVRIEVQQPTKPLPWLP